MQAVCVLRGEKPDWDTAKKVLGEPTFMRSLFEFDKDNIPESVIRKLRRYMACLKLKHYVFHATFGEVGIILSAWHLCLVKSSNLWTAHMHLSQIRRMTHPSHQRLLQSKAVQPKASAFGRVPWTHITGLQLLLRPSVQSCAQQRQCSLPQMLISMRSRPSCGRAFLCLTFTRTWVCSLCACHVSHGC